MTSDENGPRIGIYDGDHLEKWLEVDRNRFVIIYPRVDYETVYHIDLADGKMHKAKGIWEADESKCNLGPMHLTAARSSFMNWKKYPWACRDDKFYDFMMDFEKRKREWREANGR